MKIPDLKFLTALTHDFSFFFLLCVRYLMPIASRVQHFYFIEFDFFLFAFWIIFTFEITAKAENILRKRFFKNATKIEKVKRYQFRQISRKYPYTK